MHHVVLERWSRGQSPIHRTDPRAKLIVTVAFLIAVATSPVVPWQGMADYAALLLMAVLVAGLPLWGALVRAGLVLPFSLVFALISFAAGDPERGAAVLVKSYLSALAVLTLVATTALPRLLYAAERLGAPRMVVLVVQFLYRYLFVISEQGQHMRQAARCRGDLARADRRRRQSRFRAATGALAVLFGRSYQRAEAIHQAMLARGFSGHFHPLKTPSFRASDAGFLALAAGLVVAVRLSLEALR